MSIEADGGVAATATVDEHGAFTAAVNPAATTTYTAVAGGESGPPVQVLVLDRKVSATAKHSRKRVTVTATVTPSSPGATVVLQLKLKERFGWWPVRTAKTGANSRVTFSYPRGRKVAARVLLTASDGATELARSSHVPPTLRACGSSSSAAGRSAGSPPPSSPPTWSCSTPTPSTPPRCASPAS